MMEIM